MTTPTSQQDELEQAAAKVAEHLYAISDDCPEHLRVGIGIVRQMVNEEYVSKGKTIGSETIWQLLRPYFDRTVAERVLAIIGEDDEEPYDEGSRFWQKIRNRNELRAELRAVVQTELSSVIKKEIE